ncbi:MAG: hypothetical protein WCC64_02680, partial [Aliidongia sp.]
MGQRRDGLGGKARIGLAAAALIVGCGMLVWQLVPAKPRWAASLPLSFAPGRAIRDPLATGPEAVLPEAMPTPSSPSETALPQRR